MPWWCAGGRRGLELTPNGLTRGEHPGWAPKGLLPKVGNILSKQGKGPQCLVAVSQTPQPRRLEAPSRQIPFSSSSEHQPHTARVPRKASLASSPARPLRRVRRGKQAPGCPMRPWPHWCAGAFPCFPLMPKASSCVEEPALASKGIRFTGGIEPHIHTELRRSWPGSSRSHTRQGKALEAAPLANDGVPVNERQPQRGFALDIAYSLLAPRPLLGLGRGAASAPPELPWPWLCAGGCHCLKITPNGLTCGEPPDVAPQRPSFESRTHHRLAREGRATPGGGLTNATHPERGWKRPLGQFYILLSQRTPAAVGGVLPSASLAFGPARPLRRLRRSGQPAAQCTLCPGGVPGPPRV